MRAVVVRITGVMRFKAWNKKTGQQATATFPSFERDVPKTRNAIATHFARKLRCAVADVQLVRLDEPHVDLEAVDAFVQDAERRVFGQIALVA